MSDKLPYISFGENANNETLGMTLAGQWTAGGPVCRFEMDDGTTIYGEARDYRGVLNHRGERVDALVVKLVADGIVRTWRKGEAPNIPTVLLDIDHIDAVTVV